MVSSLSIYLSFSLMKPSLDCHIVAVAWSPLPQTLGHVVNHPLLSDLRISSLGVISGRNRIRLNIVRDYIRLSEDLLINDSPVTTLSRKLLNKIKKETGDVYTRIIRKVTHDTIVFY